jgi:hypothetical protein
MTEQELKALLAEKHKKIAEVYPKKFMDLMMDVFQEGFNVGIEVGVKTCSGASLRMIPVEERLPLEGMRVLCRMKSNGQIVSGYLYKEGGRVCVATDSNFHFEDYCDYEATHWYPLVDVMGEEDSE